MSFSIMQNSHGMIWAPVDQNARSYATCYVGQLVYAGSDGVLTLAAAVGAADTNNKKIPYGVVVGTNNRTPVTNSTSKAEYITSADPHAASAETYALHGGSGPYPQGDLSAYVLLDLIGPDSVLRGSIFNAAVGTAITVGTVTTNSTTGAGFTCSAGLLDFTATNAADLSTVYCRTGGNRGIYRNLTSASTTIITVDHYFPYDIAVNDTFVGVAMRAHGVSYVNTDALALYFNAAAAPDTNYWIIDVIKLDLSTAGSEYVVFKFNGDHFCKARV